MKKTRKKISTAFKTKVVIESLKEQMTIGELSSKFEIHPNQILTWKSDFLSNASVVFERSKSKTKKDDDNEQLYKVIGQQKVEIDFLKQVLGK